MTTRRIRRFLGLSGRERRLLASALIAVGLVRLGIWVLPFRTLRTIMLRFSRPVPRLSTAPDNTAGRVAWAVKASSRYIPRATCLTQAIAVKILLARRGQDARLRIGVARDKLGFRAHAWIEAGGSIVLGGTDAPVRYKTLAELAD